MTYKLFLDDERFPPNDRNEWLIVRTVEEAQNLILKIYGDGDIIKFISFDNDLGDGLKEGYDLAKWLVDSDLDGLIDIPQNFTFYVHSQNCKAVENINSILNSYWTHKYG